MPAVDLLLFMDDMLHISRTSNSLTASSTQSGYAIDNAREADLAKAWKPANGVGDETLGFDPATDSDVGTLGQTVYFAWAYDARNSNQNNIRFQVHNGISWGDAIDHVTEKTGVRCVYSSFGMPVTPYQQYRLVQLNSDRSGGTTTAKIYNLAMFNQTGVIRLSLDFTNDAQGAYGIGGDYRVSLGETAGGHRVSNERAKPGQRFTISFGPGSRGIFDRITNDLIANGGTKRSIYVQKTGLKNAGGTADFFMCRLVEPSWSAEVARLDQYEMALTFETVPWL